MSGIYYEDIELKLRLDIADETQALFMTVKKNKNTLAEVEGNVYPWESMNHIVWRLKVALLDFLYEKRCRPVSSKLSNSFVNFL